MKAVSFIYHDVIAPGAFDASGFQSDDANIYKLSTGEFELHVRQLASASKQKPVTVSEYANNPAGTEPVFLTFDDGGVSAYTQTCDILERFGWRGHFFIATDYIGTRGFLDRGQIRELRARGHEVGSHSCSHPIRMSECSREQLDREWGESVKILSDILGESVTVASVPGGYYSSKVAETAGAAGIRVLFNSEPVVSSHQVAECTVLGRYSVQQGVSTATVLALARREPVVRLRQAALWNAKKVLKKVGGRYWLAARQRLLSKRS